MNLCAMHLCKFCTEFGTLQKFAKKWKWENYALSMHSVDFKWELNPCLLVTLLTRRDVCMNVGHMT